MLLMIFRIVKRTEPRRDNLAKQTLQRIHLAGQPRNLLFVCFFCVTLSLSEVRLEFLESLLHRLE